VAARTDLLRTEIEKARGDLARHLRELKGEAKETEHKAVSTATKVVGAVVAAYVAYKILKFVLHRLRS
jgi:hypothetical protein